MIAKARGYERGFPGFVFDLFTQYQEQGPDYIVALLKGYEDAAAGRAACRRARSTTSISRAMRIAMPPPLSDGRVDYTDGTPATLDQYAKDVAAFLMWAAEPHLEQRKRIGHAGDDLPASCSRACSTSPRRRSGARSRSRPNRARPGSARTAI